MNEPMIRKVANGYMVLPNKPYSAEIEEKEVFVFETWEKMITHLKYELDNKKL